MSESPKEKSPPAKFTVLVNTLKKLSGYEGECLNELFGYFVVCHKYDDIDEVINPLPQTCICGTSITIKYHLRCVVNDEYVFVGSSCIKNILKRKLKMTGETKNIDKVLDNCKRIKYNQESIKENRLKMKCMGCGASCKYNDIDDLEYHEFCYECMEKPEKLFIKVPYEKKEFVKQRKFNWDPKAKKWYFHKFVSKKNLNEVIDEGFTFLRADGKPYADIHIKAITNYFRYKD